MQKQRCSWSTSSEKYLKYHDEEWGVPCHDDKMLFEMLCLEGQQAGLSWITILNKRENYRNLFADFHPEALIEFSDDLLNEILKNPGIIRNKLKVYSIRSNAFAYFKVNEEFGSFDKYIWSFVNGKTIQNQRKTMSEVPAQTKESLVMSKDLKKRGFKFVGATICYAYMQAVGMVNDHMADCFRY
jgi:DNA-3-methyladenine glycosylase I